MKILIIGGVAGGASCAARLRRLDEKAEITILERGEYVSFANCGLPYYIGGKIIDRSDLTLQTDLASARASRRLTGPSGRRIQTAAFPSIRTASS